MPKAGDLASFNVKKPTPSAQLTSDTNDKHPSKLITKGFRVTPEAAHQFEMLRSELGRSHPKEMGPRLISEALNLLFQKHGKPPIA